MPLSGAITVTLTLMIIVFMVWRTAQTTAIVRRAINRVALDHKMTAMRSGPARVPLIAPSLAPHLRPAQRDHLRRHDHRDRRRHLHAPAGRDGGLRHRRRRKGKSGRRVPTIAAWLDTPGGIAVAPNGDIYFADSNNDVIDKFVNALNLPVVSSDNGKATR